MTATPCQVCKNSEFKTLYSVRDNNQGAPGAWTIEECAACGLGRLAPFPEAEEIGSFYQDIFYDEKGERFQSWMETLRKKFAGLRGRKINRMLPERGELLDFGSGAGHFCDAMRDAGWNVIDIDPFSPKSSYSHKATIRNGDEVLLDYPDNHFDVITLWYVIEHLRNPGFVLTELFRVLKPGGAILLSTQDFDSVQAKYFGADWLFLDPPRHLFQFSSTTLCRMAEDIGYKKIDVDWASIELGPFTILQSIMNKILGNRNYLFRFLQKRGIGRLLPEETPQDFAKGSILSLLLLPFVGPVAVFLYFYWQTKNSGDIFNLYLKKP